MIPWVDFIGAERHSLPSSFMQVIDRKFDKELRGGNGGSNAEIFGKKPGEEERGGRGKKTPR